MSKKADTTASILAQIASYGPFLPGSVRETTTKRPLKDGTVKEYAAQPIYTWTDPEERRQKCRRIPKAAFKKVRASLPDRPSRKPWKHPDGSSPCAW